MEFITKTFCLESMGKNRAPGLRLAELGLASVNNVPV